MSLFVFFLFSLDISDMPTPRITILLFLALLSIHFVTSSSILELLFLVLSNINHDPCVSWVFIFEDEEIMWSWIQKHSYIHFFRKITYFVKWVVPWYICHRLSSRRKAKILQPSLGKCKKRSWGGTTNHNSAEFWTEWISKKIWRNPERSARFKSTVVFPKKGRCTTSGRWQAENRENTEAQGREWSCQRKTWRREEEIWRAVISGESNQHGFPWFISQNFHGTYSVSGAILTTWEPAWNNTSSYPLIGVHAKKGDRP